MIVVKRIDFDVYPDKTNTVRIPTMRPPTPGNYHPVDGEIEDVAGRVFVRPSDGTRVKIGMTVAASEVLGIQCDAWEAVSKEVQDLKVINSRLRASIGDMMNAGFLTRLRWLFHGVQVFDTVLRR